MAKKLSANDLSQFAGGSSDFHPYKMFPFCELSNGAVFVMENGGGWLIDAICSWQKELVTKQASHAGFQAWNLRVNPHFVGAAPDADTLKIKGMFEQDQYELTCTDGNGNLLARQTIAYTDFPLYNFHDGFTMFAGWDVDILTIFLPIEY